MGSISLREKGALDPAKTNEGEWLEVFQGIWIKVAYASLARVRKVAQEIRKEKGESAFRAAERSEADGDDKSPEGPDHSVDMLARALVLDWSGVQETQEDGSVMDLECTPDNIRRVFSDTEDEDMSNIREMVTLFSQNAENFKVVREKEALGKN